MTDRPRNVLSFDVEHWYTATLLREEVTAPTDHLAESLGIVLDILADHDVTATFFVVGEIARDHPALVSRIADAGHEIGSHGHTHRPLFELTKEAFADELTRSRTAIHDVVGAPPAGFRAPNFSVTRETPWAVGALEAAGYRYDSSVFPVRTPMYGVSGAPVRPYRLDRRAPFEDRPDGDGSLVELPLAVLDSRFRLPVAGGFYARLLPTWLLERAIRRLNARGLPATLYFHPWEFNPAVTTPSVPAHKRFVSFHGIDGLAEKLDSLLDSFAFTTAAALVEEYTASSPVGSGTTRALRGGLR